MLTMTLMLLLGMASISTLSSLRAYVNGEGRWSKAESQAIADLRRYSVSGDEADYERFRQQLSVPLGDRDPATAGAGCPSYEILCDEQTRLYARMFRS